MVGIRRKPSKEGRGSREGKIEEQDSKLTHLRKKGQKYHYHEEYFKIQTKCLCGRMEEICLVMRGLSRWTTP